jgi:hypothetical protein
MATELKVYTLPEELVLPLIASWRTMEKAVNPVFQIIMKCSSCGKLSDLQLTQGPAFVLSKKDKNGMPVLIGIQCKTEDCDMVIKFERPISPGDTTFPQRLKSYPKTALINPDGKGTKTSTKGLEEIKTFLEIG